jgi:NAD(P)H-flavin reductase
MAPKLNPWQTHGVRIAEIRQESRNVESYALEFTEPTVNGFAFQPGQFNMLYLPGVGEAAISVSAADPATGRLIHTVRKAGNVTSALRELGVGGRFGLRGPFGSSWPVEQCRGRDLIVVTGGIGLPPLRPVIHEVLQDRQAFGDVTLLYGARTPGGLLFPEEQERWQQQGIRVETTVDRATDDWTGHVGVVTLLLDRVPIRDPNNTVLMTCGPEVMMFYTVSSALNRGLEPESIWMSLERNMNCAIGLCGHCQFGPAFICKDGPVLRYDRIALFLKVQGF